MSEALTKEIKLGPKEKSLANYRFVFGDLNEGLNYGIAPEFYNETLEGIGSDKRIEQSTTAKVFEEDFRQEWNRLLEDHHE